MVNMKENENKEITFPSDIIEKDLLTRCISPGIHITNPYTGLGKSYALSHAAVNGLLDNFTRVVYIVPQLKLRDESVEGIMKHVRNRPDIKEDDVLVLRSKVGNFTEIENPEYLLKDFTEQFCSVLEKISDEELSDRDIDIKNKCKRTIEQNCNNLLESVNRFSEIQKGLAWGGGGVYSCDQNYLEYVKKMVENYESFFL